MSSPLAVVPGLVGVTLGGVGRRYVPERYLTVGTLVLLLLLLLLLLLVIGVRLTTKGVER